MQVFESVKLAILSINSNKLRSILTLLGIAVGLFSIIVVMTAISAIQSNIENVFNSIGSNNLIVQKYPVRFGGGPRRDRSLRNRKDLEIKEGLKLQELATLPAAVGVGVSTDGKTIKYGNYKTNPDVGVAGTNFDYFRAFDLKVEEGRNYSNADDENSKFVCVIGTDIVDKLFKSVSPLGQTIKVDNFNFEVIGVFEKRGSIFGQSRDNFIAMPISTFERCFGSERSANFIVMARNEEMMEETKDEAIGILRKIRKVSPTEPNDFEIVTNDQLIEQFNDLTKYVKLGAAVIAFIAIIAAGIGIMNIMLVSVTERTREIGIRKAIGARSVTILTQFVLEAIALSWLGGLIGIILGVVGGNIVAGLLGFSVVIPVDWIVIGLIITTVVGVVFGVYPAMKAANLDPIESLRYE
jgi:putative ABC transport system permease protein